MLIAAQPNRRTKRSASDGHPDADAWFDGGALRYVTGSTEYFFDDGSEARVAVTPERLDLVVKLAGGGVVEIRQRS